MRVDARCIRAPKVAPQHIHVSICVYVNISIYIYTYDCVYFPYTYTYEDYSYVKLGSHPHTCRQAPKHPALAEALWALAMCLCGTDPKPWGAKSSKVGPMYFRPQRRCPIHTWSLRGRNPDPLVALGVGVAFGVQ